MKVVMILIIAVCGDGYGTGCGIDIEQIPFKNMELCEYAMGQMFPPPGDGASGYEINNYFNPKREILCVENTE